MDIRVRGPVCWLSTLCFCVLVSACSGIPLIGDNHTSLDASIDAQLEKTCPLPDVPIQQKVQLRIIRGEIILAAIAGYANTSISSYSSASDLKADSVLVLEKLKIAHTELNEFKEAVSKNNNMFDLYRADLIIAAGGAADAALRPTLRTVKTTVFSPSLSLDRVKRSKQLLLNLLKDELYLTAIENACRRLDPANLAQQWRFATERFAKRCEPLARRAELSANDYCAQASWQAAAGVSPVPSVASATGLPQHDQ
ncbi:hypothetical protein [Massilia sp. ST3]|uniref:hypothetical protein n=1 Tax=Massilia sp. ST3 TaxID=2824903 RepID=UPI001B8276CE|nr:hypothetical protein [Massilia sp. ST3]MBQ5949551.1 hypothetical protein [Massilia sp. ST3]